MAAAQTPETQKAHFFIDEDASLEAVSLFASAQESITADADLYEQALNAYTLHPKAAMAVLALLQENADGAAAIQRWHEVFTEKVDQSIEFDPKIEKALQDNTKHKELIKDLQNAKGDEDKIEAARLKVRASRMGRLISLIRDATPKEEPATVPGQNPAA